MKITARKFDKIVDDLLEIGDIELTLFGQKVTAHIKEWGAAINGYYIVFRTESPEGYDTKFAIFDDELLKIKY